MNGPVDQCTHNWPEVCKMREWVRRSRVRTSSSASGVGRPTLGLLPPLAAGSLTASWTFWRRSSPSCSLDHTHTHTHTHRHHNYMVATVVKVRKSLLLLPDTTTQHKYDCSPFDLLLFFFGFRCCPSPSSSSPSSPLPIPTVTIVSSDRWRHSNCLWVATSPPLIFLSPLITCHHTQAKTKRRERWREGGM